MPLIHLKKTHDINTTSDNRLNQVNACTGKKKE